MDKKVFIFITFISIIGCQKSPEQQARLAINDYCGCVKENLFLYRYKEDLYAHCDSALDKKYHLFHLWTIRMERIEPFEKATEDSINRFINVFIKHTDSCNIPELKYKRRV